MIATTVFLFGSELYSIGPILTPICFVRRLSALEARVCSLHSLDHCSFMS
jgi:hypothetical protein